MQIGECLQLFYHTNTQTHNTSVNIDNKDHILGQVHGGETRTSLTLYHY